MTLDLFLLIHATGEDKNTIERFEQMLRSNLKNKKQVNEECNLFFLLYRG